MKVVFMGTPRFAVVSLQKLIHEGVDIRAVVTAGDKPAGRGQKIRRSAVKEVALAHQLPVLQPVSLKDEYFRSQLIQINPDLILVVAFRILPPSIFSLPPLGTVNLHASLLPKYRGAAPINWAIINGETETGVTTFFIDENIDTGRIIDMKNVPISPDMTAGELHDQLAEIGANLLLKTTYMIQEGRVKTIAQDQSVAGRAPKINHEDCRINFNLPAKKVHDFIRGLSPYPAAYTFLNGRLLRLFNSRIKSDKGKGHGGEVLSVTVDHGLHIQCGEGIIEVYECQLAGKKRMTVQEFIRGNPVSPGTVLK